MKKDGIICGVHYDTLHTLEVYKKYTTLDGNYKLSETTSKSTVSLPFHENLTKKEIQYIIEQTNKFLT